MEGISEPSRCVTKFDVTNTFDRVPPFVHHQKAGL